MEIESYRVKDFSGLSEVYTYLNGVYIYLFGESESSGKCVFLERVLHDQ